MLGWGNGHIPLMVALATLAGLGGGVINLRLLQAAADALTQTAARNPFVLSSLLRTSAFAILAGLFAAVGPWWSMVVFLAGFFIPLALHVVRMVRQPPESL